MSKEPWAWAVVDPNGRLHNEDGDQVDRLICWDRDSADFILDYAMDRLEEGREKPFIVSLYPAGEGRGDGE